MLPKIRVESNGDDSDNAAQDSDDLTEVDKLGVEFLWKIKGREVVSGSNYNNNITTS
jgi:hypothetical protein